MNGTTPRRRRKKADATTAELLQAVAGERIAIGDGEARRMSQREALAHLLWDMALRGDLAACRLLLEYMEGKPLQRVAAALGPLEQPELTADDLARAEEALLEWRE